MVDALRAGVELKKQLAEDMKVELKVALMQLPTITPVGMAICFRLRIPVSQ